MLNLLKKIDNIQEAHQTLIIIGAAISSHIISFWFLPISVHFWISQQNQLAVTGEKSFSRLSQKEIFLEPITGEPVSATMSIALFC